MTDYVSENTEDKENEVQQEGTVTLILYPTKISFRNEREMKHSPMRKLRDFVIKKISLKKLLKEVSLSRKEMIK